MPLPVDPETFRESAQHYAVFDQTVGNNPFNFFDPKIGFQVRAGYSNRGFSARILALQGHDKQSGIPLLGTDTMEYGQEAIGSLTFAAYRYDGTRPDHGFADRFWRQGYGMTYAAGRWASDIVLQKGHDTSFDGAVTSVASNGGFTQLRYELNLRLFGLMRYEGTDDPTNGLARDLVTLLGYRVSRNSRLTVEDVIQHIPQTKNTLNMQYTVGY